jgi:hypothetical protein
MNMQNLMAQAQRMQREITKKQEEIYKETFVGESEWVKVTMTGKRDITRVEITYTGDLNEDKDMLSDMITIALNDANKKLEKEIESKLGMYSKQLGGLM